MLTQTHLIGEIQKANIKTKLVFVQLPIARFAEHQKADTQQMFASAVVRWIAFGWAAGLASLVISAHPKFSLYIQKECVGFQLGECNDVVFDFRKAKRFIEFKFHRYHSCLNFN